MAHRARTKPFDLYIFSICAPGRDSMRFPF